MSDCICIHINSSLYLGDTPLNLQDASYIFNNFNLYLYKLWCLWNITYSLMVKKLHFGLSRPKNLLPVDLGVSHMPLDELRFNELS